MLRDFCTGDGNLLWTTLVGVLHANGQPMRRTPDEDEVRFCRSSSQKRKDCPELVGRRGRATWVILAGEVGGRWSGETEPVCQSSGSLRIHLYEEADGTSLAFAVGVHALLCRPPGLWPRPCWISVVLRVQMVRPLPPMKLTGSSSTLGWRDPGFLGGLDQFRLFLISVNPTDVVLGNGHPLEWTPSSGGRSHGMFESAHSLDQTRRRSQRDCGWRYQTSGRTDHGAADG